MPTIALSSIRPNEAEPVCIVVSELTRETLFSLDREMRKVVAAHPLAEWHVMAPALAAAGYKSVAKAIDPVFCHPRAWDEHMTAGGFSFLVTFPHDAPYELSNKLVLASPRAWLYTQISADSVFKGGVVLINEDFDPVYDDALAWLDADRNNQVPIGPVLLPAEQFADPEEYEQAKASLIASGYSVRLGVGLEVGQGQA